MPLPTPEFGEGQQWDGTTPRTRPNTNIFKRADGEITGRHSSEILALEELLKDIVAELELLQNPGAANSVLSVKSDQTGLEYKTLVEGINITITYPAGSIMIASNGGVASLIATSGEALAKGDIIYMKVDGKVWKAKANADLTSVALGLVATAVNADASVNIILLGELIHSTWSLTIGEQLWLSPTTAGDLTNTPPSATGQYVVPIGVAIATDILSVKILTRIKL
jgi:hypothetical protein